jgi:hypothetical protein
VICGYDPLYCIYGFIGSASLASIVALFIKEELRISKRNNKEDLIAHLEEII